MLGSLSHPIASTALFFEWIEADYRLVALAIGLLLIAITARYLRPRKRRKDEKGH